MSQPKTKASELVERLNDLIHRNEYSDFVLKQIRRDADSLKKSDVATSFLLLGMVASLEHNLTESREYHEKALKLCDNFVTNSNYATSLHRLGAITEATRYLERALKFEPENLSTLDKLINNAIAACRFRYAQKLVNRWNSMSPSEQHSDEEMINDFVSVVNEHKVSDEEAKSLLTLASTHLLTSGATLHFASSGSYLYVFEEDSDRWIDYNFIVDKGVDDIVEMNCGLADLVAEKIDSNILKSIVVRFSAAVD